MPSLLTVTDDDAARGGSLFRDLSQLPASSERFIEASSEISELQSPTGSIDRAIEQADVTPQERRLRSPRPVPGLPNVIEPEPFEGVMLSAEEANERVQGLGLKPFMEETPEDLVDLLARRKKREIALQSILDRSPGTFTSARGIGAQFLAQVKDPINIASAFIPVVGPTRFAAMAGRLGVTRARLLTGVAEGGVGAALVEPIVLGQALSEQADYGLADAFLNVVFGTVLGGGLHVGGGRVADLANQVLGRPTLADRVSAMSVQSKERLLRSAVVDLIEGRPVEIEVLFTAEELAGRQSRRAGLLGGTAAGRREAIDFGVNLDAGLQRVSTGDVEEPGLGVPFLNRRGQARAFRTRQEAENTLSRLDDAQARIRALEDGRFLIERRTDGRVAREPEGAVRRFKTARAAERFKQQQNLTDAEVVPIGRGQGRAFALVEGLSARDLEQVRTRPEFFAPQDVERSRVSAEAFAPRLEDAIRSFVERERAGGIVSLSVDGAAAAEIETQVSSQRVSADLVQSAQEEMDEAMERLDAVREATGLGAEETAESFAEFDEGISAAQARGRAARAAALCQVRR